MVLAIVCATIQPVAGQKGNQGNNSPKFLLESQFQDYIPVSPVDYDEEVEIYDAASDTFTKLRIKKLAAKKETITQFLSNEAVATYLQQNDMDGSVKFGPASFTGAKGSYTVLYDYCKFATLKVVKPDGTCPGFVKVGVGLRIRANIQTFEANVDVSSLFGLAVQASNKKLAGQFSVDVIGMESPKITDLLTLPIDISQSSVQTALQSMAAIKSKIYDAETRLYPQIVAVKKSNGGCSVFDILDKAEPVLVYQSEQQKLLQLQRYQQVQQLQQQQQQQQK